MAQEHEYEEKKEKSVELVSSEEDEKKENFLIDRDKLLAAGIHIGTKLKTSHSEPWIYRTTGNGLYVINLEKTDERIRIAAKFLSKFEHSKILITSVRRYGKQPVKTFAEVTGASALFTRFIPGTLTNAQIAHYNEADVLVIIDPHVDKQALSESVKARIPVIALFDTDDRLENIDFAIPSNNRGRKALSMILWLLARQILRERGELGMDEEPKFTIENFMSKLTGDEHDQE